MVEEEIKGNKELKHICISQVIWNMFGISMQYINNVNFLKKRKQEKRVQIEEEERGERRKTLKIVFHANIDNSAWSWFNFC